MSEEQPEHQPERKYRRLRPSGGYRELRSFQTTTIIYDGTVAFCDRCIDKRSRTHDQMVQAARSGRRHDWRSGGGKMRLIFRSVRCAGR